MHPTPDVSTPVLRSRLWLVFVVACALQMAAWTAWIIFASRHPVAEVPVATAPSR